jgi:hypothetical protein
MLKREYSSDAVRENVKQRSAVLRVESRRAYWPYFDAGVALIEAADLSSATKDALSSDWKRHLGELDAWLASQTTSPLTCSDTPEPRG